MPDKVYIYALHESGNSEVRYVGQAIDPKTRLYMHTTQDMKVLKTSHPKRVWIEDVLKRNGQIVMDIIDTACHTDAAEKERYWIEYYKKEGHHLTNVRRAGKSPKRIYPTYEQFATAMRKKLNVEVP